MQNDLFTVKLLINKHFQVVLFLVDVNGYIDTGAFNFNWDGPGVVLVFKEQSEFLVDFAKLQRNKVKLDFGARVAIDFSGSLKGDCGQELVKFKLG